MEWYLVLLIFIGGMMLLMTLGIPIAFSLMLMCITAAFICLGGQLGMAQFIRSLGCSITGFTFLPIPMFVLMGEVMFRSGIAIDMIDTVDKWLGPLPGRLGLVAVAAGTLFAVMSGSTSSSTALLGKALTPEMQSRGYKPAMSVGPIIGSGGLAMMIPPSSLAIILAAIAFVPIGTTLIAIIVPGLIMAILYGGYIIIRCWFQPSLAPSYEVAHIPTSQKLKAAGRYVLPLSFIIFAVLGVIFLGIATPTEAAATGALSCFILAAANGKLSWKVAKQATLETVEITVMIFMLIAFAIVFGEFLSFSGATRGLVAAFLTIPVPPVVLIIIILIILMFVGMVTSVMTVIVVLVPVFMPIIKVLGFAPVWFIVLMLLTEEMATTSPPYGMNCFVMKSVVPGNITLGDIYKAGLPFLCCDAIVMALMIAFPQIVLWLPSMMR